MLIRVKGELGERFSQGRLDVMLISNYHHCGLLHRYPEIFIDRLVGICTNMKKSHDYCVYDGKEFIITGREAKNVKGSIVIELKPKICELYGVGDEFNRWVSPNDTYMITAPKDNDED